jgi:hypothetical protein
MPFPISLSSKGKMIALILALVIGGMYAVYALGRYQGAAAARTVAAEQRAQEIHAATVKTAAAADSLARSTAQILKVVELAKKPHARAIASSDAAVRDAERARAAAVRVARDTTTQAPARAAIDSLARADSVALTLFHAERAAAQKRLQLDSLAMVSALATIDAKDRVIVSQALEIKQLGVVITDLKRERPGIFRRAVTGLLVGGAAAGCGALGSVLGGPMAAIAAGGACAAAAGGLLP